MIPERALTPVDLCCATATPWLPRFASAKIVVTDNSGNEWTFYSVGEFLVETADGSMPAIPERGPLRVQGVFQVVEHAIRP